MPQLSETFTDELAVRWFSGSARTWRTTTHIRLRYSLSYEGPCTFGLCHLQKTVTYITLTFTRSDIGKQATHAAPLCTWTSSFHWC